MSVFIGRKTQFIMPIIVLQEIRQKSFFAASSSLHEDAAYHG
jgi:hypothetical protein